VSLTPKVVVAISGSCADDVGGDAPCVNAR
jgi:hypothetical protein